MAFSPTRELTRLAELARTHRAAMDEGQPPVLLQQSPRETERLAWEAFREAFKRYAAQPAAERATDPMGWIVDAFHDRPKGRGRPSLRAWWRRNIWAHDSRLAFPGYTAPRGRPSLLASSSDEARTLVRLALKEMGGSYERLSTSCGLTPDQLREIAKEPRGALEREEAP